MVYRRHESQVDCYERFQSDKNIKNNGADSKSKRKFDNSPGNVIIIINFIITIIIVIIGCFVFDLFCIVVLFYIPLLSLFLFFMPQVKHQQPHSLHLISAYSMFVTTIFS